MQTCDKCEKYAECTSLCASAEKFVNQDYVSRRKFPSARLYPEGSERFWKGFITLDWTYAQCGLDDCGSCATLEKTLNEGVDLDYLSENQRYIIERFCEGKTLVQIASELGVGEGTVFRYFHRAKRKMKEKIEGRT